MGSIHSLSRRIIAVFLTLAALTIGILIAAYLGMRSMNATKNAVLSTRVADVRDAEALARYQDRRTADLRGYLLTESREQLQTLRQTRDAFLAHLTSLEGRVSAGGPVRNLTERIRSLDEEFSSVLQQAFRHPIGRYWILQHQVKPRREALEAAIGDLSRLTHQQLQLAQDVSNKQAAHYMHLTALAGAGTLLFLLVSGLALLLMLRGEQASVARSQADRTVLHTARERAALLAETGRILSESAAPKEALGLVADLAVEWLSQVFMIELTEGQDVLKPVALATAKHSARAPLLVSLHEKLPEGLGSLFDTSAIMKSPGPVLQTEVTEPRLLGLGVRSYIGVPLRARGRNLGLFLLVRLEGAQTYDNRDVQFARELSHQTALAIDNARLLQQAEVGMRMREELLATVAHDLKAPLSIVRMTSEIADKEIGDPDAVKKRLGSIRDAAKEMNRLIHDLLELTQIEAGRIVLDRHPHDSADLIDACYRALAPQAAVKSIEIVRDVHPGECIADCDRHRVMQILSNLAGNAIKFTAPGGRIRIDAQATGEGIRFSVIDNGPGIPTEQLPYVFEKYWQARRAQQRGTGLGLSIARGLVEAHGGRIWAESALKLGSRFFFTLPEARVRAASPGEAA